MLAGTLAGTPGIDAGHQHMPAADAATAVGISRAQKKEACKHYY